MGFIGFIAFIGFIGFIGLGGLGLGCLKWFRVYTSEVGNIMVEQTRQREKKAQQRNDSASF